MRWPARRALRYSPQGMAAKAFFPTLIHYEALDPRADRRLERELLEESLRFAETDHEGQAWCRKNYPGGYTSYSSMSELHRMSSTFVTLRERIDRHVLRYARALDMDVKNHKLEMTQCWVNVVPKGVSHSLHLHPLASISGTYYVKVPRGPGGDLKFEDPRMACFMASMPRIPQARPENRRFVSVKPQVGRVVLFESWLRHEVEQNLSNDLRVSVSFNYNWF